MTIFFVNIKRMHVPMDVTAVFAVDDDDGMRVLIFLKHFYQLISKSLTVCYHFQNTYFPL